MKLTSLWRSDFEANGVGSLGWRPESRHRPTAKRTKDRGGQVLNGPMEVPGGQWIVQCSDPQGAMFAMLGSRR